MTRKKRTYLAPQTKMVAIDDESPLLQISTGRIIDDEDPEEDWKWDDDGAL